MVTSIIAGVVTFGFTTVLTIAGVGAAFILIPVFMALGIDVRTAMATALLLNSIAMSTAAIRFARKGLIMWRVAVPILIVAAIASPLGAIVGKCLDREILMWLFAAFLLVAAFMMMFYTPATSASNPSTGKRQLAVGMSVGAFAGFVGGLLGVGGGNLIVPALVQLGYDAKKAAGTTAFIVIFSSFSGFLGHAGMGNVAPVLLGCTAIGSLAGAFVGAWLMTARLNSKQTKRLIGVVLAAIALKIIWGLV